MKAFPVGIRLSGCSTLALLACAPAFAQTTMPSQTPATQADTATAPPPASPAAQAAPASPEASYGADIIVTANKRQQSINDVGLSITAETGETLIKRNITSPTDLGKIVPGLTVQSSQFNTPVYTLRGIGFYETTLSASPTVAVYTDEVALPFAATTR